LLASALPILSQNSLPTPTMQMQEMNQMTGMDKIANSVTKMSEMCQMMMNKEMAAMHYKVAAGIILVVFLIIVLALLIVREIQWIKSTPSGWRFAMHFDCDGSDYNRSPIRF